MTAIPASAPRALTPLTEVAMFVGSGPVNIAGLREARIRDAVEWTDYFELDRCKDSNVKGDLKSWAEQACIANAYLIKEIQSATTVFGYRAGRIANHSQTPVDDDDKLARFFDDPKRLVRYLCYSSFSKGNALVLEFDTAALMQRLTPPLPPREKFSGQVHKERDAAERKTLRGLLNPDVKDLTLYRTLHAVEHVLISCAARQIGNEQVLGSRLFLSEGFLLIYEREPIGRGGVVQLVNGGPGLLALLRAAADQAAGCAQGCIDGCPSCIFVRDQNCSAPFDELGRDWLPPNALLSRTGARRVLTPHDAI